MSSLTITAQMLTEREFGFIKMYNSYVTHTGYRMLVLEGTYNSETVFNCMISVAIFFPVDDRAGVTTLHLGHSMVQML